MGFHYSIGVDTKPKVASNQNPFASGEVLSRIWTSSPDQTLRNIAVLSVDDKNNRLTIFAKDKKIDNNVTFFVKKIQNIADAIIKGPIISGIFFGLASYANHIANLYGFKIKGISTLGLLGVSAASFSTLGITLTAAKNLQRKTDDLNKVYAKHYDLGFINKIIYSFYARLQGLSVLEYRMLRGS